MKLTGAKITLDQMIMARCLDALNMLLWTKTKDASKNKNRPKSVFKALCGYSEDNAENNSYSTPEEFMSAWLEITKGNENG